MRFLNYNEMKRKQTYFYLLSSLLLILSCSSDDNAIDEEKPTITINYDEGFPQACEELERGQTYNFKAKITDNKGLSSYSLDIHNNFDHHTHDDQLGGCVLDEKKDADNPLLVMDSYSIDEGGTAYEINLSITIPNDVDTGDYHCSYSVIDETGWQSRTSVDIKIVE